MYRCNRLSTEKFNIKNIKINDSKTLKRLKLVIEKRKFKKYKVAIYKSKLWSSIVNVLVINILFKF